jgi:transcriptional regulator with XRE-family HTH domain
MGRHELADPLDRGSTRLPAGANLRNERGVVDCCSAEAALAEMMRSAERLDVSYEVVHSVYMRRICPSRQAGCDGYIRKLNDEASAWDNALMSGTDFDLDRIKRVLAAATAAEGDFTQRSLDKAAEVGRGTVNEILSGKNANPTVSILTKLARGMGKDLSVFGLQPIAPSASIRLPSEDRLTVMMSGLLKSVGLPEDLADEHADALAQRLPAALEQAGAVLAKTRAGRSSKSGELPRPPATPDRDSQ